MKDIKHKLITVGIIIVWLFACNGGFSQTYNPAQGTVSNKPYAPAQATPTDSRSYFYDASNFIWRPYQSTTEVLSYLNLAKYRTGQFSIYVNPTGVLNPDGTFTGGTIAEYWFKNGTANGNLVLKTDSTKANQSALVDTAAAIQSRLNAKASQSALVDTAAAIRSNMGSSGGAISITANNGTGIYASPTTITGTGSVRNDTSNVVATKSFVYKIRDSLLLEQDTLVLANISTSGIALLYSNITSDTGFIKRIKSGNATTAVQNPDSSFSVDLGGTSTSNINISTPGHTFAIDSDSSDLTLNTLRAELRWSGARTTNDYSFIKASGSGGLPYIDFIVGGYLGNVNWGSSFTRMENKFGFEVYPSSRGSATTSSVDSSGSLYHIVYGKEDGVNKQSFFGIDPRRIYLNAWDSVMANRPIQYVGNIHSLFTPYSLVDVAYIDSVIGRGSATLDFGSTSPNSYSDLTITVTGAVDGDPVALGVPNGSYPNGVVYSAWVSSSNTVTVRLLNATGGSVDPASGTFKVRLIR